MKIVEDLSCGAILIVLQRIQQVKLAEDLQSQNGRGPDQGPGKPPQGAANLPQATAGAPVEQCETHHCEPG